MKQILVKLLISLKQAVVSLFSRRRHSRVEIDSNHDGKADIVIDFNRQDVEKGDYHE